MNNGVYALPGFMAPAAKNWKSQLLTNEDGSVKLCVYVGKPGTKVYYSLGIPGWNWGFIKDAQYFIDKGYPEEVIKEVSKFADYLEEEVTELPEGTVIPDIIINGWPLPITESPIEGKVYWILNIPKFILPAGDTEVQISANGKLLKYTITRPAFSIHNNGPGYTIPAGTGGNTILSDMIAEHANDTSLHITDDERTDWNERLTSLEDNLAALPLRYGNDAVIISDECGKGAIALGGHNKALGAYSTALGYSSQATENQATTAGYNNKASGSQAIAIGSLNIAKSTQATALGYNNQVSGSKATALGYMNTVTLDNSTALGSSNKATGTGSTAVGFANDTPEYHSTALGYGNKDTGYYSTALGISNKASGTCSAALGDFNYATGNHSIALGYGNNATAYYSTTLGIYNEASGNNAVALGVCNVVGDNSIALGQYSTANANSSTALGPFAAATANSSTALGISARADKEGSLVISATNKDSGTSVSLELVAGTATGGEGDMFSDDKFVTDTDVKLTVRDTLTGREHSVSVSLSKLMQHFVQDLQGVSEFSTSNYGYYYY